MKSSVIALIGLAVISFSGAAYAGQATKPAAMSAAEMDKVTAGDPGNGNGIGNAFAGGGWGADNRLSAQGPGNNSHPGGNSDWAHNH